MLVWRQVTKDGQKGRKMPKAIERPEDYAKNKKHADHALANKRKIAKALGIEEVIANGN